MKIKTGNNITLSILTIAAIICTSISVGLAQTPETVKVVNKEKEAIEQIVREYLLKNPSIIRDAMQALQAQEEAAKRALVAESMKTLKSDIYSDPDSPSVGNVKADVPIVVFFDYKCGHCKNTLPGLKDLLAQDPSLRIIYKEFPIMGPQSQAAALAALAAKRQGKYAEFHHALMETGDITADAIKGISDRLKMNFTTLQKDISDPRLSEALNKNVTLANKLGINGTPAYIVGNQIIPGAIDSANLARIVAAERSKLRDTKTVGKDVGAMK